MIKVLHYVGVMNRAGLETFIMNVYRKIDKNEIQFGFLCTRDEIGDYDSEIKGMGGNIFHVSFSKSRSKLRHISNYLILKKELKQYIGEYGILHIHHYHAFDSYIVAKAAIDVGFSKVIVHSHSDSTDGHFKLHSVFRKPLSSLNIIRLACSSKAGKWMFGDNEFKIVKNGIDTDKFKFSSETRSLIRKELSLNGNFVWGHVGRFDQVKNHKFLVELFAENIKKYPDSVLLLVGEGIEKERIETKCIDLKIMDKVKFLGLREDVSELLQAMDVFVFPSIYEGVSLSIIEAETSGLPCVTSSNVSRDVDIIHVTHLPLTENKKEWIKAANCKKIERCNCYKLIEEKGYDINRTVDQIVSLYND